MKTLNLETLRFRAAMLFLVGILAILITPQLRADGSETLGPPSIPIASGTGIVSSGTGLIDQPGTITIEIPEGVDIKQVLLYWEGSGSQGQNDSSIVVNGTGINGTLIGGPNFFFGSNDFWCCNFFFGHILYKKIFFTA